MNGFPWPLALGAVAAAANVAGGLILVSRREWNDRVLRYFVALGAGFMLATTLVHMLPVALTYSRASALLVLLGYFIVHFI